MVLSIKQEDSIPPDTTPATSFNTTIIIIVSVVAPLILIAAVIFTVSIIRRKRRLKIKNAKKLEEHVNIEIGHKKNNEKEHPKSIQNFMKLDNSSQQQSSIKDSSFLEKCNSTTDRKFLEENHKGEDSPKQHSFGEIDQESRKEEYPAKSIEAVIQQFNIKSQQEKIRQLFKGNNTEEPQDNEEDNNEENKEAEKTTKDIAVANMSMSSDNHEEIESENVEHNGELDKEIENQVGKYVISESFVPNFGAKMKSNEINTVEKSNGKKNLSAVKDPWEDEE